MLNNKEIYRLASIATKTGVIPDELKCLPKVHFCYDWDGLLVWEGVPEFECCTCDFEKDEK